MSTGVRILPRDTAGYVYDGIFTTYQVARMMQEQMAALYPDHRGTFATDARHINRVHLRRLLVAALREKFGEDWLLQHDRFSIQNLPRADRRVWQLSPRQIRRTRKNEKPRLPFGPRGQRP